MLSLRKLEIILLTIFYVGDFFQINKTSNDIIVWSRAYINLQTNVCLLESKHK